MGKIGAVLAAIISFCSISSAEEFLVKYKSENLLNISGLQVRSIHRAGKILKIEMPNNLKSLIAADKNIEYIVPNVQFKISEPLQTIVLKKQYALQKIKIDQAWLRTLNRGSRSVTVAVIDTGVDYNHKNLAGNILPGYDFVTNDSDPMDETAANYNQGHGTHCAGVIGANGLVDGGMTGISPQISIIPLRTFNARYMGTMENAIKAIDYAIAKKVQIISASWSAPLTEEDARPLIEALARAEKAGILFVAAAANDGKSNDKYNVFPANAKLSNVISVAASNESDRKASYSNYGKASVTLSAPGDKIISTVPGNKFIQLSGTSMSTPLVAGLLALLKAQEPSLTPPQAKALLQVTGAKVNIETACNCRIDALAAVDALLAKKPWLVPAALTLSAGQTQKFSMKNSNGFVKYTSSNTQLAMIDEKTGVMTAKDKGVVIITATDERGNVAKSLDVNIIK